jgi:hypothetical protein
MFRSQENPHFVKVLSCTILFRSNLPLTNSQCAGCFLFLMPIIVLHLSEYLMDIFHRGWQTSYGQSQCMFLINTVLPANTKPRDHTHSGFLTDSAVCCLCCSMASLSLAFLYLCIFSWWIRSTFFAWRSNALFLSCGPLLVPRLIFQSSTMNRLH